MSAAELQTKFVFPSVTPIPFQHVDGVWWDAGKPRCSQHRGVALVRADLLGKSFPTDGGSHVCAACMRVAYEAHRVAR